MIPQQYGTAALRVTDLSCSAIKEHLKRSPFLLLPVGSLEPVGTDIPIGTINRITECIAGELCSRLNIIAAPLFAYGHATPFQSFEGCSGLHASTLSRSVYDCCNGWFFNGFKRIIVLTCAMDGSTGIAQAIKRLNAHPLHKNAVTLISIQEDGFFRSYCEVQRGGKENGRSEWGLFALNSFLGQSSDLATPRHVLPVADVKQFSRWRKCGRDPEKLRKIAPDALLSPPQVPGRDEGETLFLNLVDHLTTQISSFLTAGTNDS